MAQIHHLLRLELHNRFLRLPVFVLVVFVATTGGAQVVAPGNAPWPTRGWSLSTPESQGVSSRELARVIHILREHRVPVHDIVIVRHGYLLLDASFFPYRKGEPHDLASVIEEHHEHACGDCRRQGGVPVN